MAYQGVGGPDGYGDDHRLHALPGSVCSPFRQSDDLTVTDFHPTAISLAPTQWRRV